ncbi:hypothetical protein [Cryptosporangium phraense]|uniref:Uncharacterized protein n=1 Tax=Cryptosporangium phraense TaxID=2593070 RepID=A0A545AJG6_9ACTN|nr:hypothetical protein [Cryptosporangium phraense]TQS41451.1 hypothetical protein FL583_29560 [Cryptosporangium phraense]
MASKLESLASELRSLADQVNQHRAPVVQAAQQLREAASTVQSLDFDAPVTQTADGEQVVGPKPVVPAEVGANLAAAAEGAKKAVGPLTETATLLRTFASRLATGLSGATTGEAPAGEPYQPGESTTDSAPPASEPPPETGNPARPAYPTREMPPEPHDSGPLARPRYGRYPTTTAAHFAPGNRSYEVGTQPQ